MKYFKTLLLTLCGREIVVDQICFLLPTNLQSNRNKIQIHCLVPSTLKYLNIKCIFTVNTIT